jgi:hypothetical protein
LHQIEVDIKGKITSYIEPIYLLSRNAIDWSTPRNISAFVTPNCSVIKRFSRSVVGEEGELPNLRRAAELFSALKVYGIGFVKDPKVQEGIDYVQYPRETLRYRMGDCDDLSVL